MQPRYVGDRSAPLHDYRVERGIFRGKRYAPVELVQYGRGCRFACDFCSIHSFYGTSVRVRLIDGLLREIEPLPAKRLLFFVDDNLFSNEAELGELLNAMRGLKRRWSCQISIDVARDQRLLDRLAEAGCRFALIGFESPLPANLKQMAKPWNKVAGPYQDVVRALHSRGIGIYGTFLFGYDADTRDTIDRTCRLRDRVAPGDRQLQRPDPYAGFGALQPSPRRRPPAVRRNGGSTRLIATATRSSSRGA
ncbi:MAG: radical SAM protein [Candidatus Moduliflexus flocculans]|nr:radical SAM protein [Candidatus Moduliflexus flocculans]